MPDHNEVARVLLSSALCVECLMAKTGQTLDQTLDAIAAIEANVRMSRVWGRCPSCGRRRGVLTLP
jgi:hypothetical protein